MKTLLIIIGLGFAVFYYTDMSAFSRCQRDQAKYIQVYDEAIARGVAAISDPREHCRYLQATGMLLRSYGNKL